ncbi:MAG: hypothetical protein RJA36_2740 [Pseudomonadota bacterium]|jgi:hypothetical protein
MNPDPRQTLEQLQSALDELRAGRLPLQSWLASCRAAQGLLAALPPRFGEVLQQLLDRLESSALFTEESCSFSQQGLLDNAQFWLDKARERLNA